jgi:hypothetical protein
MKPDWKEADFDRLVDGELSPDEYRRLVSSLDTAPDGWRRLGCAFLEGQAWRQDLRPQPAVQKPPLRAQPWWMRPSPQWLALAAALMLVFALGTQIDQAQSRLFAPSGESVTPQAPLAAAAPAHGSGEMRVLVNRPGVDARPTEVPVFDVNKVDPRVWQLSTDVPDDVVKDLEASGRKVVHERRFLPIHLDDGRTIVIPIERIEFVPRPTY